VFCICLIVFITAYALEDPRIVQGTISSKSWTTDKPNDITVVLRSGDRREAIELPGKDAFQLEVGTAYRITSEDKGD
jgi:hypothetical protein